MYNVLGIDFHRYIYHEGDTIQFMDTEIPQTGQRRDVIVKVDGKTVRITEFMATPMKKGKMKIISDYHYLTRLDPSNKGFDVKTEVFSIAKVGSGVNIVKIDDSLIFQVKTHYTKSKNAWKVLNTIIHKTMMHEELTIEESIDLLVLSDMEMGKDFKMPIKQLMIKIIELIGRSNIPDDLKSKIALCEIKVLERFFIGDELSEMIGMLKTEVKNPKILHILDEWGPGFDEIYLDGVTDGKIETARNLLADGFDEEFVSHYIGLSIDQIREIKREL